MRSPASRLPGQASALRTRYAFVLSPALPGKNPGHHARFTVDGRPNKAVRFRLTPWRPSPRAPRAARRRRLRLRLRRRGRGRPLEGGHASPPRPGTPRSATGISSGSTGILQATVRQNHISTVRACSRAQPGLTSQVRRSGRGRGGRRARALPGRGPCQRAAPSRAACGDAPADERADVVVHRAPFIRRSRRSRRASRRPRRGWPSAGCPRQLLRDDRAASTVSGRPWLRRARTAMPA